MDDTVAPVSCSRVLSTPFKAPLRQAVLTNLFDGITPKYPHTCRGGGVVARLKIFPKGLFEVRRCFVASTFCSLLQVQR